MAASPKAPEPFSSIDAAWLRMDEPTNLMMIVGVLMFDEPLDFQRLQRVVEQRMLSYDRFRQRVVYPQGKTGAPHWEFDPHFDIRSHVRRIALPHPGDKLELERVVSDFMSTPLDPSKPLWQMHLIENFGTGCAVLNRLHHCIGDGIALMRVLLAMTDATPDGDEPTEPRRNGSGHMLDRMVKPMLKAASETQKALSTIANEGSEIWRDPLHAVELMQEGISSTTAATRLLTLPPDPPTAFKGPLGVTKLAVWSEPISLDTVKAVGRMTASTVNDVVLACMTGALRRYLIGRGEDVDGLTIRAAVPVNMRPADAPIALGNRFSLIFLGLPIGVENPLERLLALKDNMDAIKGSAEALVSYAILGAMGAMPEQAERMVLNIFGSKATGVMTNVPGPRQTIYFAGKPVRDIMFWVPQSGHLGLGVSILSYAGSVRLGITTDAGLVPNPEVVIEGFHAEFDELTAMMQRAEAVQAHIRLNGAHRE